MVLCIYCILRVQKCGNDGPKNAASTMGHKTARNSFNYFPPEMIADVIKTNSYVNNRFYFPNSRYIFNYCFIILKEN